MNLPARLPVLYVDDEEANRIVIKHNFERDFDLVLASSGRQALEILEREPIAVLMSDQRMPEMTGVELMEQARKVRPESVRVILTAYSDIEATIDAINRGQVSRFVKKPWSRAELAAVLRDSLETYCRNRLVDDLQAKLISTERTSTIGLMAASIAHDMRQPLAYLHPTLDLIHQDLEEILTQDPSNGARERLLSLRKVSGEALGAVDKLVAISNSLLVGVSSSQEREKVDLAKLLHGIAAIMKSAFSRRGKLQIHVAPPGLSMEGSPSRLSQLFMNLISNSLQALGPREDGGGVVRVLVEGGTDRVDISVEDTGRGIPPECLPRIFEPFFSTKGKDGTGLGLAICKDVVEEHGGTIEAESTVGEGARFMVRLPRRPGSHQALE